MYSAQELGRIIRLYRAIKGYSQKEFANECGINERTLMNIEYASRNPHLGTLLCIANAIGISVETLLGVGEADMNPANMKIYEKCVEIVMGGYDK